MPADIIKPFLLRDDVSRKLVHLIRDPEENSDFNTAEDILMEILKTKTLLGGTGCIKGDYRCVCFSEAPISKLGQVLALSGPHGMRYKPFGIMVDKIWLYRQGGRPVIYQADEEYDILPDDLKYRHVRYDPPRIDFSWEREWRIKTDKLPLDPADITVIVPYRHIVEHIKQEHSDTIAGNVESMRLIANGFFFFFFVIPLEWHFIALEDLGVATP